MSAIGGTQCVRRWALLLAVAAAAAVLAGCEYADDVDAPPSGATAQPARTAPARAPLPTRDPKLDAREATNTAELERLLGAVPETMLLGRTGTIGGAGSAGGFNSSVRAADAGPYTVTVACVGAPDAQLFLRQDGRNGGAHLELTFDCEAATQQTVELEAGPVEAGVMRYNGGGSRPGNGAVAGFRIVPAGPGH